MLRVWDTIKGLVKVSYSAYHISKCFYSLGFNCVFILSRGKLPYLSDFLFVVQVNAGLPEAAPVTLTARVTASSKLGLE